jgi:hypothetical protein
MKKLLAIIVLGLLLNGCYGASVRNHSNIQDKTVTIFNPETNKYYKSIKFISYADAYNDANQKCVSDTVSKNKNPEFCFAFSGFNGFSNVNYWEANEPAWLDTREELRLKYQKEKKRVVNLENLYGKECEGSFFSKGYEKGTKEYENCKLEKDKIAKAKVETEKKAIAKRQIETDKKLAAMTPKQRHAYNCTNAFNFRKGTEKFNDCVFKLYTAELDIQKLELEKKVAEAQIQAAANQQARAEAVANAQIAAAKASQRAASLNNSIQLMQMGSSMLGSSAPKSNSSFGIENRVRTTCRNVGGFINCN